MTVNLDAPASALAIAAHPDDVEFNCGGTLAKWAATGCVVHHLICTDGSKGTWDIDADTAALVARRQDEQREAARRLGASGQVVFLGEVDGELESGLTERSRVARTIRELRPEVVFGHDPWKRWRLHPDHHHAGKLAVEGIVAARDPHFFPEHGVRHHRPDALLLFETEAPNHHQDVGRFIRAKTEALLAHASQFETTMYIADDGSGEAAFRQRIIDECRDAAAGTGLEFAEAFHLIDEL